MLRRNTDRHNTVVYANLEVAYRGFSGWYPEVLRDGNDRRLWSTGGDLAATAKPVSLRPESPALALGVQAVRVERTSAQGYQP